MTKEILSNYPDNKGDLGFGKIVVEIQRLNEIFSKELTPELSMQYLGSLVRKLERADQPWETFVAKGEALHQFVGENLYGPLIVCYVNWVKKNCDALGYSGNVYFALRDAAPLETAAAIVWEGGKLQPVGLYANRPILGIEDEISLEESQSFQLGLKYLESKGIHENGDIVWADSGAWGTVVKLMKQTILTDTKLYPFFWYSHNPYIPGYLNSLMEEARLPEKMLETINDSLECMFPQPFQRPVRIINNGNEPEVVLVPSTELAVAWGRAALDGVSNAARQFDGSIAHDMEITHLKMLAELSTTTLKTNEWTGVLPHNTPTWSHGPEFLVEWPKNLLP